MALAQILASNPRLCILRAIWSSSSFLMLLNWWRDASSSRPADHVQGTEGHVCASHSTCEQPSFPLPSIDCDWLDFRVREVCRRPTFEAIRIRGERNKLADQVNEENPLKDALLPLSRTNSVIVSGPQRNSPHIGGTERMKVRLPSTFLRRIDLYAKLTDSSQSAILTRFFEWELLLYMRSQRH